MKVQIGEKSLQKSKASSKFTTTPHYNVKIEVKQNLQILSKNY